MKDQRTDIKLCKLSNMQYNFVKDNKKVESTIVYSFPSPSSYYPAPIFMFVERFLALTKVFYIEWHEE